MTKKTSTTKKAVPAKENDSVRHSVLSLELKHTLSSGDIGGQVYQAQDALIGFGFSDFKKDGRFGTMMGKAVRLFQDSVGLKISGEINPTTWQALFEPKKIKVEDK
jgi:peptidoglycan hydrolase-like protein with peptidoglycan-binding domain